MEIFVAGCSLSWSERATSCYVLDDHILFDCGEGTSKNVVKRYGEEILQKIDWIFITHLHADHIFAIDEYLTQSIMYKKDFTKKLTFVGPEGLKDAIRVLFKFSAKGEYVFENYINIFEVNQNSDPFFVDGYKISMFDLHHGEFDDIGYVIDDGKQKLGYTGDTEFDLNLIKMVEACDAMICDVSGYENTSRHMGVAGYNELKNRYPNKSFYAVHCNREVFLNAKKLNLNLVNELCTYTFESKKLKLKSGVKFAL